MASSSARFIYEALLASDASPDTLRRVVAYADRVKDTSLLCDVLRHSKLDQELENTLSKRTEADVLSTWASRPGRSTDELISRFSNEKRATLLSALAKRSDLPDVLYMQLANTGLPTVCQEIALNAKASIAARSKAAESITGRIKDSYRSTYHASNLLGNCPQEVIDSAVINSSRLGVMAGLINKVSEEAAIKVASKAADLAAKLEGWDGQHLVNEFWKNLGYLKAREIFRDRVVTLVAEANEGKLRISNNALSQYATISLYDPIDLAISNLSSNNNEINLRNEYDLVMRGGNYSQRLTATEHAVRNGVVEIEDAIDLVKRLPEDVIEAVITRRGSDAGLGAFLLSNGDSHVYDVLIKHNFDIRSVLESCYSASGSIPYHVKQSKAFYSNTEFALLFLSVNDALRFDYGSVASKARSLMLESLLDNPEKWEMFEKLAPEWSGNLPSLLEAVSSLTSKA
ncbi:MAG: hypothetical protein ACKOW9_04695 [Candidatus Paceibacterota bacterium]